MRLQAHPVQLRHRSKNRVSNTKACNPNKKLNETHTDLGMHLNSEFVAGTGNRTNHTTAAALSGSPTSRSNRNVPLLKTECLFRAKPNKFTREEATSLRSQQRREALQTYVEKASDDEKNSGE